MFAAGEVIFLGVDERQSQVEHQVDEQGTDALRQEHLHVAKGKVTNRNVETTTLLSNQRWNIVFGLTPGGRLERTTQDTTFNKLSSWENDDPNQWGNRLISEKN